MNGVQCNESFEQNLKRPSNPARTNYLRYQTKWIRLFIGTSDKCDHDNQLLQLDLGVPVDYNIYYILT